jgi:hypothetical protein
MTWIVLLASIIIAIVAITPYIIKKKLNAALNNKIPGYKGKVEHLSVKLFSGHLQAQNLHLISTVITQDPKTRLQIPLIDVEFKWASLLKKILDLKVTIHNPILHIESKAPAKEPVQESTPIDQQRALRDTLEKMMSFKVALELIDGEIQYVNPHTVPVWSATIYHVNCQVQDFSNRVNLSNTCRLKCDFQLFDGTGEVNLTVLPLASDLTAALEFELKSMDLVRLNRLFRAYANVDINSGFLDLSSKIAIAENNVKGYIEPILHHLDIVGRSDRSDTLVQKIRERVIASVITLLLHRRNDTLSLFIPIEGRLDDPSLRDGAAILAIVRKAAIKALLPSIHVGQMWRRVKFRTRNIFQRLLPKAR